jgi:RNA polymerase sigma factor (sigma-70 family)
VRRLPEFDQVVFELVYYQGLTQQECLRILDSTYPGYSSKSFHEARARLHEELPAYRRWQLSMRSATTSTPVDPDQVESNSLCPESIYRADADRERLGRALSRLDPDQRLLLQLRYQQDLTLKEVAALLRLPDPFAARRAIDKALKALRKAMQL